MAVLCAGSRTWAEVYPPPEDPGHGLLLYAPMDRNSKAAFAVGNARPLLHPKRDPKRAASGSRIKAVVGGGMSRVPGSYAALGNILSERGTIAAFVKRVAGTSEVFQLRSADRYYWGRYFDLTPKGKRLEFRVADENFGLIKIASKTRGLSRNWVHVALSWDQALGAWLYVNGEEVARSSGKTWTSRGMSPGELRLGWERALAYDELYVFDRPLRAAQIKTLYSAHRPPSRGKIKPWGFSAAHRQNRRRELGWSQAGSKLSRITLGRNRQHVIKQVAPTRARAYKRSANSVFDGKRGGGWPEPYFYSEPTDSGLSIELPAAFDRVLVEGSFRGKIHRGEHLRSRDAGEVLAVLDGDLPVKRVVLQDPIHGSVSFFRDRKTTERPTWGWINEVTFTRKLSEPPEGKKLRFYLGRARLDSGDLGRELESRYGPGDRSELRLRSRAPRKADRQVLAGLRYQHLVIPSRSRDWGLKALRIHWSIQKSGTAAPVRVELHDPLLPGRRVGIAEAELHSERGVFDLTLDIPDRVVPAGKALWVSFVFGERVELDLGKESFVELTEAPVREIAPGFVARELPMVQNRFRALSELRPWNQTKEPSKDLVARSPEAAQLFNPLVQLHELEPENAKVSALWSWTHPHASVSFEPTVLPTSSAPRWALLQREIIQRSRKILYWWIENRQGASGEFGDGWNDDTDLIQNFPALIHLGDPGGRLRNAAARLADAVYVSEAMRDGLNAKPKDALHAYEDGVNAQLAMALIDVGDPRYLERILQAARVVDTRLLVRDSRRRARFRSVRHSASGSGGPSYDSPHNALLLHPALTLAYFSRNPKAIETVTGYADLWLSRYAAAARNKKRPFNRRFPARVGDQDRVVKWAARPKGYGFASVFAAAYALSGDSRYRKFADVWLSTSDAALIFRGNEGGLPVLELLDRDKRKSDLVFWSQGADLSQTGHFWFGAAARRRYFEYELNGREKSAYQALEAVLNNLRSLEPAYTWAEPITDRIWLPLAAVSVMAQGESPHERNQLWPRHDLSYEGFEDFAGWVREASSERLVVWLYNFEKNPRAGSIRLWKLPHAQYRVTVKAAESSTSVRELHPQASLSLTLAPESLTELAIERVGAPPDDYWNRPDLALARGGDADNLNRIRVFNLGRSSARDIRVAAIGSDGKVIADRELRLLKESRDYRPSVREVDFGDLSPSPAFFRVDPQSRIRELNEFNNELSYAE